ncbi:phage baseplate assembly protein V [bacterium]|nr:phage baseplate assembly protein V [bacterium]
MNEGFFRAIVKENQDPDHLGKIRVEYPWFEGDSAEHPSEWVDVCSPYASGGAGFWFIPEVGDEVLVYLKRGNLDFPVVLGMLYSQKHKPQPTGRGGEFNGNGSNDLKYLATRAQNLLCFDDSDNQRGILLQDKQGRRLQIESQADRVTLSDAKNNRICIENGTIRVQNKAGDEIVIESGSIRIHANSVKVEAAASLELGAGASEALVKGQSFMALFNAHTHVCSGPGGSSSPPATPMTPAQLSTIVKTA